MIVNHMELTRDELYDLSKPIIEKYTKNLTFKSKALELIAEIKEGETLIVDRLNNTIRLYLGKNYTDPDKCLVWYENLSSGWIAALFRGGSVDILEITIVHPTCQDCIISESSMDNITTDDVHKVTIAEEATPENDLTLLRLCDDDDINADDIINVVPSNKYI